METIDARGLECPKPVIKTKECVDKGSLAVTVHVDNEIAASNVKRFLEGRGYAVVRIGAAPEITLTGTSTSESEKGTESEVAPAGKKIPSAESWALLLASDKIGADSAGLGGVLMSAYLGTIQQNPVLPSAIALMNEGVKMALPERSTSEVLAELIEKGVPLLICGTCTKHFGITEQIKIGVISNMFEISDALLAASKPVVIG